MSWTAVDILDYEIIIKIIIFKVIILFCCSSTALDKLQKKNFFPIIHCLIAKDSLQHLNITIPFTCHFLVEV